MKTGLILEGGAMRGMFTAGVMDVMLEAGIAFDGVVGVSAGAAFGCNYVSGQIGRVLRYNTKYASDKRYSGLGVLLREGNLFSTPFCYHELPLKLDPFDFDAFSRSKTAFHIICTDVETGQAVCHRYGGWEDHGFDWIRASASMPLVSQMVEIDGRKYLDGGIADSVPVKTYEALGYCRNVVILTQPKGYVKKKNKLIPLMKLKYPQYPKLVKTMANRHLGYNGTLAYIEEGERNGRLLVIRPSEKLNIGRAEKNPEKLREVYQLGRAAAEARLAEIRAFTARNGSHGEVTP